MARTTTKAELRARSKSELRGLPKKQRKVVAREVAREQRLAAERHARRVKVARRAIAGVAAAGVVVVAVMGGRAWVAGRNRGPENMLSDGVLVGGDGTSPYTIPTAALAQGAEPVASIQNREYGVLDTTLYVDYTDPDAGTLWSTISSEGSLSQNVLGGTATIEIHPIAPDGSASAVAAAAAIGCVAELAPDQALAANDALLTGGTEWTTETLVSAFASAGIDDAGVAGCIQHGRFTGWVTDATARAEASVPYDVGSVSGTTLLLAGTAYDGAPDDTSAYGDALAAAWQVIDAASQSSTTDSSTTTDGTATDGATDTGTATDGTTTDTGTATDGTATDGTTTDGTTATDGPTDTATSGG
ncbi:thioredoxin domain-containing protein [Actinotalea sp. M2MS4P-6]|uniref:DsbA family protein n=1 Tax=Actinotalea sp. M2MS4P-6 TaxID=2983762 RepID=UPI0021E44743|nr:thioredoxin domain-containing protein [Actinotalea sp. M2MS4P-6]MCV2393086.1 thioredoxin domain-containing protein [Actinotalea sp. M2MS4P-6]